MTDSYTGEITNDGKFQCYITKKTGLDYMKDCDMEFKATPWRTRLLISNEAVKSIVVKSILVDGKWQCESEVEKIVGVAGDNDKFTCSISGVIYNTKQELSMVFLPSTDSFFKEKLLISTTSCLQGLQELQKNKVARERRYTGF